MGACYDFLGPVDVWSSTQKLNIFGRFLVILGSSLSFKMCTIFGGVQFFLIHNLLFQRDELIGARYDLVVAHYNLAGGLS